MADNNEAPPMEAPRRGPKPGFKKALQAQSIQVEPKSPITADASILTPDNIDRQEYLAEIERIRSTRKPFGSFTQKLALPPRPGYKTHWFNDVPGRIDEAKEGGWSHRKDDKGKPLRRVVGTGRDKGALYAYAMDIPVVFWEEDLQLKFERARSMTDGLKSSPVQTKPGSLTSQDKEKFYTPREVTIQRG